MESEAWCAAGNPYSSGETFAADVSLPSLTATHGIGPTGSISLPLLPVSIWLLLYILSYKTSVSL